MNKDQDPDLPRQLRDLSSYTPATDPAKKKEKVVIESYDDIVSYKPSTKRVREYYRGVLRNISLQQQDFGEL